MSRPLLKIPPFRDAHIHLMLAGHPLKPGEFPAWAEGCFSRGVLSVWDMGHRSALGLKYKKNNPTNSAFLTIQSSGFALYKRGTYGGFLGRGVSGQEEIKAAIQVLAEAGADYIKVINSGIVSLRKENPVTEGGFSLEEWKVLQAEAEKYHLKIRCHANSDRLIQQAVDSGASSIEHGFFISRETLGRMSEKGVSWTPTVGALQSVKSFMPPEVHGYLNRIIDDHLEALQYAAARGVTLKVGTDCGAKGVQAGEPFFAELRLFQKAGLSFDQIVAAACFGPEETDQGTYLLVENNFVDLGRVETVVIKGRPVTGEKKLA